MNRRPTIAWTLLAAVLLLSPLARATDALEIGASAPMTDVAMVGIDGQAVSIADVAGEHGTLVIFSCYHCPWVKAWDDRMTALGNEFQQRGIGVMLINSNDPDRYPADNMDNMRKQAADKGYEFPYVIDDTSDVGRAFGATRTPEVFLFDADMRLVYHGVIDDNARAPERVQQNYLRDALEAVVSGTPVPLAETKALGCSLELRPAS